MGANEFLKATGSDSERIQIQTLNGPKPVDPDSLHWHF